MANPTPSYYAAMKSKPVTPTNDKAEYKSAFAPGMSLEQRLEWIRNEAAKNILSLDDMTVPNIFQWLMSDRRQEVTSLEIKNDALTKQVAALTEKVFELTDKLRKAEHDTNNH